MNYTLKMFKKDFPSLKKEHFSGFKFKYAIACEDMKKWDGDWNNKKSYMFTFACVGSVVAGGCYWIQSFNVISDVKKGEVFICATSSPSTNFSAVRATGVMTLPQERERSHDQKVRSYLTQKQLKKERPIYNWFYSEKEKIEIEDRKNIQAMNENMSFLNLPENKSVTYKIKATTKKIKTQYGHDKNAYASDFEIDYSPFDLNSKDILKNEAELRRSVDNSDEIMALNPTFPLRLIRKNGILYCIENSDFYLIENKNEAIEISYVNKWEEREMELNKKKKAINRWLKRCLNQVQEDVWRNYPHLRKA